ncbi:MAG: MFS transporter [Burkholderiales bacterium]|nr:MFS transporter [Burkholderiales bacterium]
MNYVAATNDNKNLKYTILLLCLGYFIDFYDLTIFSARYATIIPDLFNITNTTAIQLLYIKITNFYTVGIVLGCICFGVLGDKFGRMVIIKLSIIIYSLAIFFSIFTHSTTVFIGLRFLSGFGLATEFSTSSILIAELLVKNKEMNKKLSLLYFSGILGGICATFLGTISWKIMFLFGSLFGIIIYVLRRRLIESTMFLNLPPFLKVQGSLIQLFNSLPKLIKLIRLIILIVPFYLLISIMFIYPSYMTINLPLSQAITLLLIGFFIGNIISTICAGILIPKLNSYNKYIWGSLLLFAIIMPGFTFVTDNTFLSYCILLGLLGGGYPVIWVQVVMKNYGTNQRSTATNFLYAMGRGSGILLNLIISALLAHKYFIPYAYLLIIGVIALVGMSLFFSQEKYTTSLPTIE